MRIYHLNPKQRRIIIRMRIMRELRRAFLLESNTEDKL